MSVLEEKGALDWVINFSFNYSLIDDWNVQATQKPFMIRAICHIAD